MYIHNNYVEQSLFEYQTFLNVLPFFPPHRIIIMAHGCTPLLLRMFSCDSYFFDGRAHPHVQPVRSPDKSFMLSGPLGAGNETER